mmetsp:Transcript_32434/g.77913  ORF Transcript_32434/g.77913 Transcript_32434/m.77913 type:complete len:230 (-) Transcript_32434:803-1492(-)
MTTQRLMLTKRKTTTKLAPSLLLPAVRWSSRRPNRVIRGAVGTALSQFATRIVCRSVSSPSARRAVHGLTIRIARLIVRRRIALCFARKILVRLPRAPSVRPPSVRRSARGLSASWHARTGYHARTCATHRGALGIAEIPRCAPSRSASWCVKSLLVAHKTTSCPRFRLPSLLSRASLLTELGGSRTSGARVLRSVASLSRPARWCAARGRTTNASSRLSPLPSKSVRI